jgi:mannose-6-phosphate isomerase-like protein (cupin superfamily)
MKQPRVIPGAKQALHETPLGIRDSIDSFLNRFTLMQDALCEDAPAHIAVHLIKDLDGEPEPYVDPHSHPDCDEVGLVIGQPGALEYEIILDGKTHRVSSPASVYIPAGTVHRARAVRGNGAYVCMLMDPAGPHPDNIAKGGL